MPEIQPGVFLRTETKALRDTRRAAQNAASPKNALDPKTFKPASITFGEQPLQGYRGTSANGAAAFIDTEGSVYAQSSDALQWQKTGTHFDTNTLPTVALPAQVPAEPAALPTFLSVPPAQVEVLPVSVHELLNADEFTHWIQSDTLSADEKTFLSGLIQDHSVPVDSLETLVAQWDMLPALYAKAPEALRPALDHVLLVQLNEAGKYIGTQDTWMHQPGNRMMNKDYEPLMGMLVNPAWYQQTLNKTEGMAKLYQALGALDATKPEGQWLAQALETGINQVDTDGLRQLSAASASFDANLFLLFDTGVNSQGGTRKKCQDSLTASLVAEPFGMDATALRQAFHSGRLPADPGFDHLSTAAASTASALGAQLMPSDMDPIQAENLNFFRENLAFYHWSYEGTGQTADNGFRSYSCIAAVRAGTQIILGMTDAEVKASTSSLASVMASDLGARAAEIEDFEELGDRPTLHLAAQTSTPEEMETLLRTQGTIFLVQDFSLSYNEAYIDTENGGSEEVLLAQVPAEQRGGIFLDRMQRPSFDPHHTALVYYGEGTNSRTGETTTGWWAIDSTSIATQMKLPNGKSENKDGGECIPFADWMKKGRTDLELVSIDTNQAREVSADQNHVKRFAMYSQPASVLVADAE